MSRKRALSIWFPRLGAERLLRVLRVPDWSVRRVATATLEP